MKKLLQKLISLLKRKYIKKEHTVFQQLERKYIKKEHTVSRRPSNSKIIKQSRDPYAVDDSGIMYWGRRGSHRGLDGTMRGGSISRRIQESRKNENLAKLANKKGNK